MARLADSDWDEPVLISGGVNALWPNPVETLSPNVLVDEDRVRDLIRATWPDGRVRPMAEPLDLLADFKALGEGDGNALVRVSPDELQHTLILKVASRIEDGASDSEMSQWEKVLRSSNGRVVALATFDEQFFWCANERRRFKRVAETVSRLQSQIACEVWFYRARKQASLNKQTDELRRAGRLYASQLHEASADMESLGDPRVIEHAIQAYERILSQPSLQEVLVRFDKNYGSKGPFNSLSKLSDLYLRCRTLGKMRWVLQVSEMMLVTEALDISDFAVKNLKTRPGSSRAGTLELLLMKQQLLRYFLNTFLDQRKLLHKEELRDLFQSPGAYIGKYASADKTYMSSWPRSSSVAADFLESHVYQWDAQDIAGVRTALKQNKTTEARGWPKA